jgi:hypothetical protein
MRRAPTLALLLLLPACGWKGPGVAGYEGLQWPIISYYNNRAIEANAQCPQPRMTAIVRSEVVEDTPERVVMDLRYHYRDETITVDVEGGGTKYGCDDFAERRFTFARTSDGGLEVVGMSGAQRR